MQTYKTEELIKIAKRDNNKKRPYLMVNPLQGKHIPVRPGKAMEVFRSMAKLLSQAYAGERLLIIGFAETATAIGAAVAAHCPEAVYYMHTTRETVGQAMEYLFFSEVHSHATEQKLIADHLGEMIGAADRIVFAEDEVTTGNTILNLIREIKTKYPYAMDLKFGIISILNSMADSVLDQFAGDGIRCLFLNRVENRDFASELDLFTYERECRIEYQGQAGRKKAIYKQFKGKKEPRLGVRPAVYQEACKQLAENCRHTMEKAALEEGRSLNGARILVLGTEEFMYPALFAAAKLEEESGCSLAQFHATTRSPILPSAEQGYPLHKRNELRSIYEAGRVTYIYNLKAYDYVLWLHDAEEEQEEGLNSLLEALQMAGNNTIIVGKWGE